MSADLKNHNQTINVMRIVAIMAVIAIHTTTRILENVKYDFSMAPAAIVVNQLARFAVPLFFLISGYVLEQNYHKHENFWKYIWKRANKIVIPYFVWSAIYYFLIYKQHTISYWLSLAGGNASYQLYFIPTLIIFYILFPILHKYLAWFAKGWVVFGLGIVQICLLYYDYNIKPIGLPYPILIGAFNFFGFGSGAVFSHHQQKIENIISKYKSVFAATTIFAGAWVVYEGISGYLSTKNYLTFYSQWRPSVLLYTLLMAGTMYHFISKLNLNSRLISKISSRSFFVYFVHVMVLEIVWKLGFYQLLFWLTLVISFIIALGVSRVPKLTRLLG